MKEDIPFYYLCKERRTPWKSYRLQYKWGKCRPVQEMGFFPTHLPYFPSVTDLQIVSENPFNILHVFNVHFYDHLLSPSSAYKCMAWRGQNSSGQVLTLQKNTDIKKKSLAKTKVLQKNSESFDYKLDINKNIPHAVSHPSSLLGFSLHYQAVCIYSHIQLYLDNSLLSPNPSTEFTLKGISYISRRWSLLTKNFSCCWGIAQNILFLCLRGLCAQRISRYHSSDSLLSPFPWQIPVNYGNYNLGTWHRSWGIK